VALRAFLLHQTWFPLYAFYYTLYAVHINTNVLSSAITRALRYVTLAGAGHYLSRYNNFISFQTWFRATLKFFKIILFLHGTTALEKSRLLSVWSGWTDLGGSWHRVYPPLILPIFEGILVFSVIAVIPCGSFWQTSNLATASRPLQVLST